MSRGDRGKMEARDEEETRQGFVRLNKLNGHGWFWNRAKGCEMERVGKSARSDSGYTCKEVCMTRFVM